MKICIITRGLSQSWGGAERVAVNLSKNLVGGGHEVYVLTASSDLIISGVAIRIVKVSRIISPWKLISFQRKVREILKKESFDLVYGLCQVYPLDIYRVGGGIERHWMKIQYPNPLIRGIKYFTSLVHLTMHWLEGQIFKEGNCKLFITNSNLIKEQIRDYFKISDDRIKVIYNGVDHNVFNPKVRAYREIERKKFDIRSDEFVLLFVANNWERKGLKTVINAMARLNSEGVRLVVVGRGKSKRYISYAKKVNVDPDKLVFTGPVKNVEKYYALADVFVLPTMYEPFANVCLEAMACGLPVITSKTNGASELIEDGVNGFILKDWKDSEGLAKIIKRLLRDNELCQKMGIKALETAKEFTWERHIEETNIIFNSFKKYF